MPAYWGEGAEVVLEAGAIPDDAVVRIGWRVDDGRATHEVDVSAEGRVSTPQVGNDDDWLAMCQQSLGPIHQTSIASEYDWLRGLWDLDTEEGLTFTDLANVFADASPTTWWEDGSAPQLVNSSFLPAQRMLDAADANGLLAPWTDQCNNGICR